MAETPRENEALVRRFLTDVVSGGDIDAVDGFLAADIDDRHPCFTAGAEFDAVTGLGWRVLAGTDVDIAVEETVATADRVAVRGTVAGTHRESLVDLAPSGRSFEIPYAWFCRINDEGIAEIWSLPDGLGLMRQLRAFDGHPSNRT